MANSNPAVGRPVRAARITPAEIEALKARDNWTNWRYLAFNWLAIAGTVAFAIWAESALRAAGYGLAAIVPLAVVAIFAVGASQHQLGGAIHEGAHYQLFASRRLNETVSDWLAGYPIYTSTHHYRVHHLPHHQFVNDTERDPIFAQARMSGHWLDFPLTHFTLVKALLGLLWIPSLIRYTVARARYSALGQGNNPYGDASKRGHRSASVIGILFATVLPLALVVASVREVDPVLTLGALVLIWAATVGYYASIPDTWYTRVRIDPVISLRSGAIGRMSFMALLYGGLTAIELAGLGSAWRYFGLYWLLPLFTTFPIFMILREWIQHGNADRGRYTNSRVMLTDPLFRYAVLPWGMDYHLPHHVNASVPHYRLKDMHALMLERDPEYAAKVVTVEGLFGRPDPVTGRPTVFGALLTDQAPSVREAVHVDDAVLERADVADPAGLEQESRLSRAAEGAAELPAETTEDRRRATG